MAHQLRVIEFVRSIVHKHNYKLQNIQFKLCQKMT